MRKLEVLEKPMLASLNLTGAPQSKTLLMRLVVVPVNVNFWYYAMKWPIFGSSAQLRALVITSDQCIMSKTTLARCGSTHIYFLLLWKLRQEDYKCKASLGKVVRLCLKIELKRIGDTAQWYCIPVSISNTKIKLFLGKRYIKVCARWMYFTITTYKIQVITNLKYATISQFCM